MAAAIGPVFSSVRLIGRCFGFMLTYTYDSNGNMLTGANRTQDWTSFNQIKKIARAGKSTDFSFGAGHERVKEVRKTGTSVTDTTVFIGSIYEKVTTGTLVEHKNYIIAPSGRIAVYTQSASSGTAQADTLRYFHTDGLGSITAITDENGTVLKRYAYDAWGAQSMLYPTSGLVTTNQTPTTRGFTDHEMLSDYGLIHMNGRVYDQSNGRFVSADSVVDGVHDAQGYNRYTYATNNPLKYIDPTGHIIVDLSTFTAFSGGGGNSSENPKRYLGFTKAGSASFWISKFNVDVFRFSPFSSSTLNSTSVASSFKSDSIGASAGPTGFGPREGRVATTFVEISAPHLLATPERVAAADRGNPFGWLAQKIFGVSEEALSRRAEAQNVHTANLIMMSFFYPEEFHEYLRREKLTNIMQFQSGIGLASLVTLPGTKNFETSILTRIKNSAVARFELEGLTPAQQRAAIKNPGSFARWRGDQIDTFFKEGLKNEPFLQHLEITPRYKFGPDVFDPTNQRWWDVTTPGKWDAHVQKYWLFGKGTPLFTQ